MNFKNYMRIKFGKTSVTLSFEKYFFLIIDIGMKMNQFDEYQYSQIKCYKCVETIITKLLVVMK